MPRQPRTDYEDAWHHVMNRGARQQPIFRDDHDRYRFLVELREACYRTEAQLAAYCLMSNHYHLVLHTPAAGLSRTMQLLSAKYTQAYNDRHGNDGPLFRGRFKSVLIEETAQLLQATVYVHRNPVEAGLAADAAAWGWSSAAAYVGVAAAPEWLASAAILDVLGGPEPMREYRRMLDTDGNSR